MDPYTRANVAAVKKREVERSYSIPHTSLQSFRKLLLLDVSTQQSLRGIRGLVFQQLNHVARVIAVLIRTLSTMCVLTNTQGASVEAKEQDEREQGSARREKEKERTFVYDSNYFQKQHSLLKLMINEKASRYICSQKRKKDAALLLIFE